MDTILITVATVCVNVLLLYLGFEWGKRNERKQQASREEAIRAKAYTNGCEWSADFWRQHMNKTEWNALYEGHFDTKEGS